MSPSDNATLLPDISCAMVVEPLSMNVKKTCESVRALWAVVIFTDKLSKLSTFSLSLTTSFLCHQNFSITFLVNLKKTKKPQNHVWEEKVFSNRKPEVTKQNKSARLFTRETSQWSRNRFSNEMSREVQKLTKSFNKISFSSAGFVHRCFYIWARSFQLFGFWNWTKLNDVIRFVKKRSTLHQQLLTWKASTSISAWILNCLTFKSMPRRGWHWLSSSWCSFW